MVISNIFYLMIILGFDSSNRSNSNFSLPQCMVISCVGLLVEIILLVLSTPGLHYGEKNFQLTSKCSNDENVTFPEMCLEKLEGRTNDYL